MHTFYYPDHIKHDPHQLHKEDTPRQNEYYCEVAERGIIIHDAIQQANLGPITPPGDFGIEPINEVHEYGLINLLQSAYQRMKTESDGTLAVPDTFSVGRLPHRKPRSIWGQLGYYCFDTSSPILEHTWDVAYWGAQTALSAAALVLAGLETEGMPISYALCRPPGHHAAQNLFGGFCYLNNAAIAAHWLVQQGKRVAILDIDYHHGNGTQAIFYGRSDVLVCSIHADPLNEYPYFWGYGDEYGSGGGQGFNWNYPLPRGTREPEYLQALADALVRVRLYVPDVLIVCLGVDTYEKDPAGGFRLQTESFARIGERIADTRLPVVVIQEGGYHLPTLGENVLYFFKGLLGK
ncbi:MAG: histone deacetylase family protein [Chloroflexi bacterium]|nr:MAG: histone deacetylase family protein [Chloroflexota bacterium]